MKRYALLFISIIALVSSLVGFSGPASAKAAEIYSTSVNMLGGKHFLQAIFLSTPPAINTIGSTGLAAVDTPTVEPPPGYERPVIVIDGYSLDQDTISPGDSFTLFVTVYNAGQKYATNVVALFTSGELMPRKTGGVVAVGEIAPGNHKEFGQPLVLDSNIWSAVTSITMTLSYTDEAGMSYTESFVITLPVYYSYSAVSTATPTPSPSPIPSSKPQLVITGYATDIIPLQPGSQFDLTIDIQNVGNSIAKQVSMVVGGGSSSSSYSGTQEPGGISGTSGDFTNFAPIGASNIQSLGDFASGYRLSVHQPLIVNVTTSPGAYPLKISFIYIDAQNHVLVDDQVITLLVHRLPQVEISFYQDTSSLFTGQPNVLPLQVVNLGRNSVVLGNMKVTSSSGQFSNNSILVGTLDPGGYFTLDANYIPDMPGTTELVIAIDYTNDFNQPQVITKTLTVDVMEQPIIEPPIDGGADGGMDVNPPGQETFLQKVWRFILGLIGLDSGVPTNTPTTDYPSKDNMPTEQPIIIPVPIKGP